MKKIIYLFTITIFLSCSNQGKNLPGNFDFGKTENGFYKNDYFGIEVSFDSDWIVQDKQGMNNIIERGEKLIGESNNNNNNNNLKSIIKASQVNTAYLLAVFKYKVGAAVEYNPSFMLIAENTKNFPGIKNGKDYLFHVKKALKQTQIDYSFEKEVFERTLDNVLFHVLEARLNYMGKTIIQEYISTVSKGFSLSFIISYTTEEEKNELYKVINNTKI